MTIRFRGKTYPCQKTEEPGQSRLDRLIERCLKDIATGRGKRHIPIRRHFQDRAE